LCPARFVDAHPFGEHTEDVIFIIGPTREPWID
jgi:hypothetical protein